MTVISSCYNKFLAAAIVKLKKFDCLNVVCFHDPVTDK